MKHFLSVVLIASIMFATSNKCKAQNYSSGIGLLGGYSQNGIGILLNYNYYLDRQSFIQAGAFFSMNKDEVRNIEIPYNNFTFNVGYLNSVYSNRRNTLKGNIGGGAVVGYEVINQGSNTLENGALILDKSQFIYGAFVTAEVDFYLSNQFNFIVKYSQFYHVNSDLGQFTPFVGAGFRYFLF